MSRCIEFLTELGFGETIGNYFSLKHIDEDDIDFYCSLYKKNISIMRDEFDDKFILEIFTHYTYVFELFNFGKRLSQIQKEFNTAKWGKLIQYEWEKTGESSVFDLLDHLEVSYFESHLSAVCNKVRSIWVADYGDKDL